MKARTVIITLVVVLALAAGGFLFLRRAGTGAANANAAASLQTVQIERGTVVAAVNAAGTIDAPQTATLNWHAAGTVGKVNVAVGDAVKAGDVLMELDPHSLSPSVIQAQADLVNAQDNLATLQAGPTEQQLAQAQLNVVQAQEAITTAQRNLNSVLKPSVSYYQQQVTGAQNALTAAQQNAQITDFQVSLKAAEDALTTAANNLQSIKDLDARYPGYGDQRDRMKNAQAAYDKAQTDYQTALFRFQQAQNNDTTTVQNAQQALDTAQANLAAAQRGPDQTKAALYQAQLDVAKANLVQAQADLAKLQAGTQPQDITAAEAKVAAAQAVLDSVKVVAPFSGTVVALDSRPGDAVDTGTPAIGLADLSTLQIQVDVAEVDINRVVPGQAVKLTVDAAPGQTFTGSVQLVSVMGKSQQGVVTFPVTVVVPDPDPALKPGMTAAVAIVTDSHANVLQVANRAIRVSGGQRSVTVLFEGQQINVPVTLGLTNETVSEITSGAVKEGDSVLLGTTTTTTTGRGGFFGFFGGGGGGGRFGP